MSNSVGPQISFFDSGSAQQNLQPYIPSGGSLTSGESLIAGDLLPSLHCAGACVYNPNLINLTAAGNNATIAGWIWFGGALPGANGAFVGTMREVHPPTAGTQDYTFVLYVDSAGVAHTDAYFGISGPTSIASVVLNWAVPHFLCATITSGGVISLYVDGVLAASYTASGTVGGAALYLTLAAGGQIANWYYDTNTRLQNVGFWLSALTAQQIQALYQSGSTGAQTLDGVPNGSTYLKPIGVNSSGNTTSTTYGASSITTPAIQPGAVSTQAAESSGTSVTLTTSWQTLATATLSSVASNIFIVDGMSNISITSNGTSNCDVQVQLFLNGVAFDQAANMDINQSIPSLTTTVHVQGVQNGTGGTWTLQSKIASGSATAAYAGPFSLRVIQLKV